MSETGDDDQPSSAGTDAGAGSVPESLQILAATVVAMASDLARLFALDARLCGRTILAMIALTVVGALLLTGGWLYLSASAVMLLSRFEMLGIAGATALVGCLHVALAGAVWWRLRLIARDTTFRQSRATLRRLVVTAREERS